MSVKSGTVRARGKSGPAPRKSATLRMVAREAARSGLRVVAGRIRIDCCDPELVARYGLATPSTPPRR